MEKKKCGQRHILLIFLSKTNRTLQKIRSYFLVEQDYSEEYKPAVRNSPLQGLEKHAAMICTKKIYLFFIREAIKADQGLLVETHIKISEEPSSIFI